ncbi:hypothetical protein BM1_00445 [Bipolaris maydis]|nr:hypothetical protein BM1_00445 [Bipolaris maydis]
MSSNCTPPPSSPPSTSTCCSSSAEKRTERASLDGALTVVGSTLILYASFGLMSSFGFFQDYYSREFLESSASSSIAFVGTLQMGLTNAVGALSGALCDRFGVKYLLVGSGLGTTVALLMLSFVQPGQFWLVFMTHGFLMGLSMAFGVQPALTVVGQHFKERRGLALGVVSMGSALGGIGFPVMLGQVMPRWEFGGALRLAAAKVVWVTKKDWPCWLERKKELTEGIGFVTRLHCACALASRFEARPTRIALFVWILVGSWIRDMQFSARGRGLLSSVSGFQHTMSTILSKVRNRGGLLGDRVGRFNLLWPVTFLSGCLCLFLWLLSTNISTLIFFVCAYGFFSSSVNTLPTSIIGQITPDDKFGARTGAFYSVITISSLIGTPIGGALIVDEHVREGYRWLILFSGTALMVGSMFMLGSRMLHGKDSRTKRQLELS